MYTLDIEKFPKKGSFIVPLLGSHTPESIKEVADNWTEDKSTWLREKGFGHFLKEVKNPTPAKKVEEIEKP